MIDIFHAYGHLCTAFIASPSGTVDEPIKIRMVVPEHWDHYKFTHEPFNASVNVPMKQGDMLYWENINRFFVVKDAMPPPHEEGSDFTVYEIQLEKYNVKSVSIYTLGPCV